MANMTGEAYSPPKQRGRFSHAVFLGLIFEVFTIYRKVKGFTHSERRKVYRLRRTTAIMKNIVWLSRKAPLKEYRRSDPVTKYKTTFNKFGLKIVRAYD